MPATSPAYPLASHLLARSGRKSTGKTKRKLLRPRHQIARINVRYRSSRPARRPGIAKGYYPAKTGQLPSKPDRLWAVFYLAGSPTLPHSQSSVFRAGLAASFRVVHPGLKAKGNAMGIGTTASIGTARSRLRNRILGAQRIITVAPTEVRRPSHARRGFAISWVSATLVAAALVGICFHAEAGAGDEAAQPKQAAESATAELRQSLQREHDRAEALATELAKARRDLETQVALSSKKGDEAAQFKQAAESATAELRQSLQRELDGLRDLDEAAQLKQAAATAELRQSLQQEHDRAEALATELVKARQDLETHVALSSKKGDEAAQFKQAAESATAELQREHDRAEALATELAQARRTMEQKPAGVEQKPPAKQSEGVAAENSKPENKPVEAAPLPRRNEPRGRAFSPRRFYYRSYDPASGTYRSYDGRIRSCR